MTIQPTLTPHQKKIQAYERKIKRFASLWRQTRTPEETAELVWFYFGYLVSVTDGKVQIWADHKIIFEV